MSLEKKKFFFGYLNKLFTLLIQLSDVVDYSKHRIFLYFYPMNKLLNVFHNNLIVHHAKNEILLKYYSKKKQNFHTINSS